MYESILTLMYVFLVSFTFFAFYYEKNFKPKIAKKKFKKICKFGRKYFLTMYLDNCSSCSCFSFKFAQRVIATQTELNKELTKND